VTLPWCYATGQNALFWGQWRRVTVASGPWRLGEILAFWPITPFYRLAYIVVNHFVIKWQILNIEITFFPSNMKFHLYFEDSLHFRAFFYSIHNIFRNAPQSTPWIHRSVSVSDQDQREWLLTFGLGIIILQGVSRRKSLAGVNIMSMYNSHKFMSRLQIKHKSYSNCNQPEFLYRNWPLTFELCPSETIWGQYAGIMMVYIGYESHFSYAHSAAAMEMSKLTSNW
jgi:hypothetical protein